MLKLAGSRYFVGQFDAALAAWCGVSPGICALLQYRHSRMWSN